MRFRSIPGYSALFVDYVEDAPAARRFLPVRPGRSALFSFAGKAGERNLPREEVCRLIREQALRANAGEPVLANISRLGEQGSTAVVTSLPPNLLGGPLSVILRCLTAVRLSAELRGTGIPSVPIAWVQAGDNDSRGTLALLDGDSRLTRLDLNGSGTDSMEGLPRKIAGTVAGGGDPAVMGMLERCCSRGFNPGAASRDFLAQIMSEWGLIILEPQGADFQVLAAKVSAGAAKAGTMSSILLRDVGQALREAGYDAPPLPSAWGNEEDIIRTWTVLNCTLPVAAIVSGSSDLRTLSLAQPAFRELGEEPPLIWPRVSVTVVDARTRKIQEKYRLGIEDFFAGPPELLRRIGWDEAEQAGAARFDKLAAEFEAGIRRLAEFAQDDGLKNEVSQSRGKILYQLDKLRERFLAAGKVRREAALRQIERACNTVAPEGRPQECILAGLFFLLRYSGAVLGQICDKINLYSNEHQLIDLD